MMMGRHLLVVAAMVGSATACARAGYTNRVLHRVPSPDGTMIAVCQERPEFDGPGYRIRLEDSEGSVLHRLYETGDGKPCDEVAWSPDGETLGVLSSGSATLKLVDVRWARDHPSVETSHHSWREVYLGNPVQEAADRYTLATGLRFADAETLEIQLCTYDLAAARRRRAKWCEDVPRARTLVVPRPLFDERRHATAPVLSTTRTVFESVVKSWQSATTSSF